MAPEGRVAEEVERIMPIAYEEPRLKVWASEIDENTLDQARRTARLPIIPLHVSLMPDAHLGMGATVGSVIATDGAVIPAAVGVDIGCGMAAVKTDMTSADLPDNADWFIDQLAYAVPAGLGKWRSEPSSAALTWWKHSLPSPRIDPQKIVQAQCQLGTLGGGNHFAELCLDANDNVWFVLHSGSRGVGNQLATQHIRTLRKEFDEMALEDPDLAFVRQGTPEFTDYVNDMLWAQDYAMKNRELMLTASLALMKRWLGRTFKMEQTINCHHNFSQKETHFGRDLWITRKGAIQADTGRLGIIPGSMGTSTFVVEGLGNADSYESCSHGAGRRFSRTAARKKFTAADLTEAMAGVTSWQSKNAEDLVDEIPQAYKSIHAVMADQTDLVKIVAELKQICNYKGVDPRKGKRK